MAGWERYHISSDRRDYTPMGTWNIPITKADLDAMAKKKVKAKNIPARYNRIEEDATVVAQMQIIAKKATPSKRPLKEGDLVYYRPAYNRGTKKYRDIVCPVRLGKIVKVDPKTYVIDGSRINKEFVLGRMTARTGKRNA